MSAVLSEDTLELRRLTREKRMASFGPEWITIDEACRLLFCSRKSFGTFRWTGVFDAIESRPASETAESARSCGLLLKKSDCERVALIRRRCRLQLAQACRVWAAIKSSGPL